LVTGERLYWMWCLY